MNLNRYSRYNPVFLYIALIGFCSLPIWYFQYYVNQDGSPHLYNSYILVELLSGNDSFTSIYRINPYPIPNLTGHWIMAAFSLVFSPFVVSKLMISLTFAGIVGGCGWLRLQTAGREGVGISLLIGCTLAFNWLWFLGFYNFILGLIGFAFTIGLFWKWREDLSYRKAVLLSILVLLVYFSHLISFGMLFGSVLVISAFELNKARKRNILLALAAFGPTFPLLISYKILLDSGEPVSATWNFLRDTFSISDWIVHLRAADPLQLLSRKAFPFYSGDSEAFVVFSSLFWVFIIIAAILVASWFYRRSSDIRLVEKLPWLILFGLSVLFWLFSPDDFGKTHGSYLRERVLLSGLICFIPIYGIEGVKWLKRIVCAVLGAIIIFQTCVLWEFSASSQKSVQDYLAAKPFIREDDRLASIVFVENSCRYRANPLSNLNPLLGIGKDTRIWDNYELGYYLFPVVARSIDEQYFIYDFRQANVLDLCDPNEDAAKKLQKLKTMFEIHHQKISVLLIWNGDERVMPIINKWFELEPHFGNGNVKLYRHRSRFKYE